MLFDEQVPGYQLDLGLETPLFWSMLIESKPLVTVVALHFGTAMLWLPLSGH